MGLVAEIWSIVRPEIDIYARRRVAEEIVKVFEQTRYDDISIPHQLLEDSQVCPAELLEDEDEDDWDDDRDDDFDDEPSEGRR